MDAQHVMSSLRFHDQAVCWHCNRHETFDPATPATRRQAALEAGQVQHVVCRSCGHVNELWPLEASGSTLMWLDCPPFAMV